MVIKPDALNRTYSTVCYENYRINMLSLWFGVNSLLWPFNVELFGFKFGLNVVVLLMIGVVWMGKRAIFSIFSIKAVLILSAYLLSSYFVAIAGPCEDKFLKLALTAPVLFFLVLVGLEIGGRSSDADWRKLQKLAAWVLIAAFAGFILELLFPEYFPTGETYRTEGKYSGIFSEPSHVAISLFPCIAILLLAESRWTRRGGILALLGLFVFSRSSTLVALFFCWLVYRLIVEGRLVRGMGIALGMTAAGVLVTLAGYDSLLTPTIERFAGVVAADSVLNISSLVYLQGWQDAWANVQRTNGLGLGFNMMGCTPIPEVSAREALATVANVKLNTEDGSILISKLVSEAGIVGILFFAWVVWWWIRLENMIHKFGNGAPPPVVSIATALMFCFVATSLLRSAGYFSGGLLLLVVAVAASVKWRRETAQFSGVVSVVVNETVRYGQSKRPRV